MHRFILPAVVALVAVCGAGCSDDGYIKVFKCNPTYPYLNTVDNRCYKDEAAATKANDGAASESEPGSEEKGGEEGNMNP